MPKGKTNSAYCCSNKKYSNANDSGTRDTVYNAIAKVDDWFYHMEIWRYLD